MRKAMIVEDEELILQGIKNIVHWNELELKLVHMAHSGQEALEMWEKEPVDIIITWLHYAMYPLHFCRSRSRYLAEMQLPFISEMHFVYWQHF